MGTAVELRLKRGDTAVAVSAFAHDRNGGARYDLPLEPNPDYYNGQLNYRVTVFDVQETTHTKTSGLIKAERIKFAPDQKRYAKRHGVREPGTPIDLYRFHNYLDIREYFEDPTALALQAAGVGIWLLDRPNTPTRLKIITPWDDSERPAARTRYQRLTRLV
jgi:hypothetical protein